VNLLRNSKVGIVACALAVSGGVALSGASAEAHTPRAHAAGISVNSFTNTFSAMKALKPIVAEGTGKIAAIMPDTTSSTRYVEFDQPDIKKALQAAGMPASDIITPQNAQKSDTTFLTDVKADITNGAKVILIDPEDPGTGVQAEIYAKAHGAKIVQYDRLSSGAGAIDSDPYVSFNNVTVGKVMAEGLVSCVAAWKVAKPQVMVMRGAPTDNNATLFADGYDAVLAPLFANGTYKDVANPAGTWTPTVALTEFQAAYTKNPDANAVLMPNDENGAPIIHYLQTRGVKPDTFPVTGQDATLVGLQNILSGYQCGTVYKPVFEEAEAAVALAMYLRAGKTPPTSLVNKATEDSTANISVPSVLLTPEWVTTANMNSTVIADNFVPAQQLCVAQYAALCKTAGISV